MKRLFELSAKTKIRASLVSAFVAAAVTLTLLLSNALAANRMASGVTSASAAVTSALSSQYGITATPITSAFAPATSQTQAVAAAQKYIPTVNSAGSTTTLVRFTDPSYGTASAAGAASTTVTPIVSNQPVWLVVQPNVVFPVSGPPGYKGASTYTATAVAVVDAATGKFIEAMSVG